jgi:hypothetical protein
LTLTLTQTLSPTLTLTLTLSLSVLSPTLSLPLSLPLLRSWLILSLTRLPKKLLHIYFPFLFLSNLHL